MIYRIWLKDEQRYANDDELKYLRVSADGKVEKLDCLWKEHPIVNVSTVLFSPSGCNSVFIWQDVSATHEVEWSKELIGTELRKAYEAMKAANAHEGVK